MFTYVYSHIEQLVSIFNPKSRASATAGNSIGISQLTHAAKKTSSNVNLKAETASFSDEDDSAERAAILQSPVKGVKRLSSNVIDSYRCLEYGLILV